MKTSDFDYILPDELIARYPMADRTASRLLCFNRQTGEVQHRSFKDILTLLRPNDLLVFNNTKVIPARIYGQKASGGKIEVLVERVLDQFTVLAHVKASKSPKPGSQLLLGDTELPADVKVLGRQEALFELQFAEPVADVLNRYGHMPLPPYIAREDELSDRERYQTVYAKHSGAVAAPTAGLHFDDSLLAELAKKGVQSCFVTLHVGAGTFQPVRVENIAEHHMHSEFLEVDQDVCNAIARTKALGGRVIAVGTTSVRSLETAAISGELKPYRGDTNIFIYPGVKFNVIDALITNFHLPESTLIMLVSALAGQKQVMNAYAEAVAQKYRFFSYGDAMFIAEDM